MKTKESIVIGVGAVVFRGDDVLVVKRGRPPFEGQWSIPGGRLEHGERVVDAVRREVREETGLEIEIIGLLDVFDALPVQTGNVGDGFSSHTVIIDYAAEWVSGEPVAGDDAAAAEFVSYETALSRFSWDTTRKALAQAREIRKKAGFA